mmetsp:Transcript_54607/g.155419  ORF Transcript_54607/g.155419 Transcript_54607/m.155419 type:complete len:279 (+) Transcript_54607:1059-1895(+)
MPPGRPCADDPRRDGRPRHQAERHHLQHNPEGLLPGEPPRQGLRAARADEAEPDVPAGRLHIQHAARRVRVPGALQQGRVGAGRHAEERRPAQQLHALARGQAWQPRRHRGPGFPPLRGPREEAWPALERSRVRQPHPRLHCAQGAPARDPGLRADARRGRGCGPAHLRVADPRLHLGGRGSRGREPRARCQRNPAGQQQVRALRPAPHDREGRPEPGFADRGPQGHGPAGRRRVRGRAADARPQACAGRQAGPQAAAAADLSGDPLPVSMLLHEGPG